MNLKRLEKYYRLKFLRIKGDPGAIAWGSFIGAFVGIMPIMPFHTVVIVAICCCTRTSVISGMLTSLAFSNPFTYIPLYYLCMVVGNWVTPYTITWAKISGLLGTIVAEEGFKASIEILSHLGIEIVIVMLTGGIVIALPSAIVCYIFTLKLFVKIRQKRREKHILRMKKKK